MNKFDKFYDLLVDHSVATEHEIRLVCSINGHSVDSLEKILYARLGFRSLGQWQEVELNELGYEGSEEQEQRIFLEQQDRMRKNGFEWCYELKKFVPKGEEQDGMHHHIGCTCYHCL